MSDNQVIDPLEYLTQLSARGVSFQPMDLRVRSKKVLQANGSQKYSARNIGLVGSERGAMLKGLEDGVMNVAYYRMTYSSDALQKLERSLHLEARRLAGHERWKIKGGEPFIRLLSQLAIGEKFFNVCDICNGTMTKKDRKPCRSCEGGVKKRSNRKCGDFLGVDHKSYAAVWRDKVNCLVEVLNTWEDLARDKIRINIKNRTSNYSV